MGSGDLNMKKSWHPALLVNQRRVYDAEKAASDEKKKLRQLQKEREEERQLAELKAMQEASTGRKGVDKLDWMYAAPNADSNAMGGRMSEHELEQYLLGKRRVDEVLSAGDKNVGNLHKDFIAVQNANTARDTAAKIREDPMLAMKKAEQAQLAALMNRPDIRRQLRDLKNQREGGKESREDKEERRAKRRAEKEDRRRERHERRHRHDSRSPRTDEDRDRRRDRDRDYRNDRDRRDRERDERPRRRDNGDDRDRRDRSLSPRRDRSPSPRRDRDRDDRGPRRDDRRSRDESPVRNGSGSRHSGDRDDRRRQDEPRRDNRDREDRSRRDERPLPPRRPSPDRRPYHASRPAAPPPPASGPSNALDEQRAARLAAMSASAETMHADRRDKLARRAEDERKVLEAEQKARSRYHKEEVAGIFSKHQEQLGGHLGLAESLQRRGGRGLLSDI